MNLRAWLRKSPAPTKVTVGRQQIAVPETRTKWAEVEQTILSTAEDGQSVSAYSADGTLLRSYTFSSDTEDAPVEKETMSELAQLGRMISDAHDAGASRHAKAYELAFEKLVGLTESIANRLTSMELMWSKAMVAQARAQADMIQHAAEANAASAEQNGNPMAILMPLIAEGMAERAAKKGS